MAQVKRSVPDYLLNGPDQEVPTGEQLPDAYGPTADVPVAGGGGPYAPGTNGYIAEHPQAPTTPYQWNPNEPKPGDPGFPVSGFSPDPTLPIGTDGPDPHLIGDAGFGGETGVPMGPLGPELGPPVDPNTVGGVGAPDIQAAFHAALLKQLQAGPATAQSVLESPAAQAHRLASQRGLEVQRANNAETAAQNGTLGGLEGVNRGLDFATAEGDAGYTGDLAQTQETQRQNALSQALGLTQQGTQANNNLGFNYAQLQQDANYRALMALLSQSGVA